MKLSARDAAGFLRKPDPSTSGLLIYGADAMRVALKRQDVIKAMIGPSGEEEMRLERFAGADLRRDPAALMDTVRATGFFPGPRVIFVEDAGEAAVPALTAALTEWKIGDAAIVVTAGSLNARSKLRKLFEAGRSTLSLAIYDDPPTRQEIEEALATAGLTSIDPDAMGDLTTLARILDPGDFRQTLERISLYKLNDPVPLSSIEVARLAPTSTEAGIDEILNIAAEGRRDEIGPVLSRLQTQGTTSVTLSISATRHFRQLLAICAHPNGAAAGMDRLRPPIYGPRRDRVLRQAQKWGADRLEDALALLIDTDLTLRSSNPAPDMPLMERTLIRIAMMANRR